MTRRLPALPALAALAALGLAGCATSGLPPPGPGDCQIRAGAALTEGTVAASGLGGIAADARGGAVTVIGDCAAHPGLHVLTRSGSSTVCYGPPDVCGPALANAPVTIQRSDFDALMRRRGDFETPRP